MKRILVISWFFPPINSSEGLVTYKLLKSSKYEYDVYTQKSNTLWSYGDKTEIDIGKNVNRIYAEINTLEEFITAAVNYYKENIDKYDILMTRSMPEESHKIGLMIKKINPKIKWVASFGDPISNNPYILISNKKDESLSAKNPYTNKVSIKRLFSLKRIIKYSLYNYRYRKYNLKVINKNNQLQEDILTKCDYIIYNSKYQEEYMLKDQKNQEEIRKKGIVIPHSFDESLYKEKVKKENKKIVFTYIGHLDDIRTPKNLFKAINELYKVDPKLNEKVEFNFYGNMGDSDKLYIINNDLLNIIKIKKSVTYQEGIDIMEHSDWLLHIDANIHSIIDENIFFAAKLADYMGTKNNIFSMTMLDGASADILRKINALISSFSVEEIKNYLYLIIYEKYNINLSNKKIEEYNSKNVAKIFDELIDKIS